MYPNQSQPQPNSTPQADQNTQPPRNKSSTQNALMFEEIRDDMLIIGDGTFRAVIAARSVNFDLMSAVEREGVEYSYQQFLNSLTFPIQIYIRSQRVDIGPYLDKLDRLRASQDNMLLGTLMEDYIGFIDVLSQEANIMDKSFFIIIPYSIGEEAAKLGKDSDTTKGLLTNLFAPNNRHQHIKVPADKYERAKEEIARRADSIIDGLTQVGVRTARLGTKELGELYYNVYNPDTAVREPLGDFRDYASTVIRKGTGENPYQNSGGMF